MGGKRDESKWDGYERLPNYKGTGRDGSKCLQCNKTFTSATYDFFDAHKIVCKRRKEREEKAKAQASKTPTLTDGISDKSESSFSDLENSNPNDLSFSSTSKRSSSQNRDSMESEPSSTSHKVPRLQKVCKKGKNNIPVNNASIKCNGNVLEKHVAVLKFVLGTNLDMKYLASRQLQNLLSKFDPNYELPNESEFKATVVDKAIDFVKCRNQAKKYLNLAQLFIHQDSKGAHFVSLLLAQEAEPTLITYKLVTVQNLQQIAEEEEKRREDLQEGLLDDLDPLLIALNNYCDEVVKETFVKFGLQIHFLIHNSRHKIKESGQLNDNHSYCVYKSFDCLINSLIDCKISIAGQDSDMYNEYIKELKSLQILLKENNLKLFEATESFLKIKATSLIFTHPEYCTILEKLILSHFNDVYSISNYLHPQIHGQYLSHDAHSLCENFFARIAPGEACPGLGYYGDKDGCFNSLYNENVHTNYQMFWQKAKMSKFGPFCDFALTILNLPATCLEIDHKTLIETFDAFQKFHSSLHQMVFSAVIAEKI